MLGFIAELDAKRILTIHILIRESHVQILKINSNKLLNFTLELMKGGEEKKLVSLHTSALLGTPFKDPPPIC